MEKLEQWIARVDGWVWGWTLLVLIMAVGVYLTIRTGWVQVRHLGKALRYMLQDEEDAAGEVSTFGALCTALSATIGTGNIVGVATAITLGGPGALLWMLVAAVFGMATKYAEGVLAVVYRHRTPDGKYMGGPFCYIEQGMGQKWRWLARLFSVFGVLAGTLGIGTVVQVNGITEALSGYFDPAGEAVAFTLSGRSYTWPVVLGSLVVTALSALVLLGGLRRISAVTQVVVPFMAVLYMALVVTIVLAYWHRLPSALLLIWRSAVDPQAVLGAGSGITLKMAVQTGIGRGVFSNEAGLGSAPIAAAAARTKEPVRQGLVTMTGTFIDTVVMCTLTGLAIVLTGSWRQPRLEGVAVTDHAFQTGLSFLPPRLCSFLLMSCLVFFAFTTILGWHYYSERCLIHLTGERRSAVRLLRIAYIAAVFTGPYLSVSAVWGIANIFNGLMAFPNLIALLALSGAVARETKRYFQANRFHKRD